MKKILLILFVSIATLVCGQPVISTGKINGIYYKTYKAKVPSDKWVIFLHGKGECGNADGSQLDLVEVNGYPKSAKAGFDFPFNIIAPQIHTNQDYWQLTSQNSVDNGWFVNFVKEQLGASEIIVTGLSLGGRGTWQLLKYDSKQYIKAIAPVCGFYESVNGSDIKDLRSLPGYSWHHINDVTMSYKTDIGGEYAEPNSWTKIGITRYNFYNNRPTQVIDGVVRPCHYLNTLTTVTTNPHGDAWAKAYDITPGKDSLLKWMVQNFNPSTPISRIDLKVMFDAVAGKIIYVDASGKEY